MNHHPPIIHDEINNGYANEHDKQNTLKARAIGAVIAILFAIILLASTASDDAMADEIATATAMYPSAPSTAQQAAYREDGREQLRLRELLAVK